MTRRLGSLLLCLLLAAAALTQSIDQSGPRGLLEGFLQAAQNQDFKSAEQGLEFDPGNPANRELAVKDLDALLRRMQLDPLTLPDQLEESTYLVNRVLSDDGKEVGVIEMRRLPEGRWVFSSRTTSGLKAMSAEAALQDKGSKPSAPASASAPVGLGSPRETLRTFFRAMDLGEIERAAAALDLSDRPGVSRIEAGRRLSLQLLAVLNRTEFIVLSAVPDGGDGPEYVVVTVLDDRGQRAGRISLERGEDGGWRFSRQTQADLPAMWQAVESRPVLAGLRDVSGWEFDPLGGVREQLDPGWRRKIFFIEVWQWLGLLIWAVASLVASVIGRAIFQVFFRKVIQPVAERQGLAVPKGVGWAVSCFIFFSLMRPASSGLTITGPGNAGFLTFVKIGQGIALVWLLWAVWDLLCIGFTAHFGRRSNKANSLFLPIIQKFGQLLILLGVLFSILAQFGVNPTGLIAGLGISGAILALAAKDSVENLFGSATILFEAPFEIGDWVKVGDTEGTVEEINLRSTRIRTFHDSIITLPNGRMVATPVENYGRRRARRFRSQFHLSHSTTAEQAQAFADRAREMLEAREDLDASRRYLNLHDVVDAGILVQMNVFILARDYNHELKTREEIVRALAAIADELGISVAGQPPEPPR